MQELKEKTEKREWITFENQDQRIFAVLHRPLECENAPLVCVLHGFASTKIGSNRSYVYLAETLAKANIATLRFDFRGSGDSEGTLSEISFEDLVSDALCVFEGIQKIKGIDPTRLGVFGASLGGTISVLASNIAPIFKALVLWAPVASGELWYRDFLKSNPELQNVDPQHALTSFRGIKLRQEFRDQFAKMNAAKAISKLTFPVLHMHGDNDATISLAHQEAFRGFAPKSARFVTYPEADHRLGFEKIFPEVIKESLNWFKKHL